MTNPTAMQSWKPWFKDRVERKRAADAQRALWLREAEHRQSLEMQARAYFAAHRNRT